MQDSTIAQDIVYALSSTPDDGIWWAAKQSGLQRSDDGGQTWQAVIVNPEQDDQPSITALAAAPGADQSLHLLAGVMGGVFVSEDGGENWSPKSLGTPAPFITGLAASPDYANDGTIFAATLEDGIFRSENSGKLWRAWNFGLFDLQVLGLAVSPDFAQDGAVYVLTETGVYCSHNRGRSWQLTDFPMEAAPVLCMAISPDFAQDGRLYAGTEAAGLYASADRGLTWEHMAHLETEDSINAILLGAQDMLVLTAESCWRSADEGQSWARCFTDLDFGEGLTAARAPQGFGPSDPLLLGLADGRILTMQAHDH